MRNPLACRVTEVQAKLLAQIKNHSEEESNDTDKRPERTEQGNL
jgi:hypothetical protein